MTLKEAMASVRAMAGAAASPEDREDKLLSLESYIKALQEHYANLGRAERSAANVRSWEEED